MLQHRINELEAQHRADQAIISQLRTDDAFHRSQIANLEVALISARRIGTAIGVLMTRYRVTDTHAFELLRTASQHEHRKLRDVAEDVILIGELPGTPSARTSRSRLGKTVRHAPEPNLEVAP
jgi:AmiR/NasT family two-component response regulator